MGILWARILEGVAMPSSRGYSQPRDRTKVSCIAGSFFFFFFLSFFFFFFFLQFLYQLCQQGSPYEVSIKRNTCLKINFKVSIVWVFLCAYVFSCSIILTLWNPIDCKWPGSSVHGILQARILEWVAMPFSRGSSQPRDRSQVSCIVGGFFAPDQFSRSVMSNSLRPHEVQHVSLPCPPPAPRACSNSCPWSQWCHPTISSSVIPFSSCLQSFPIPRFFPMSQFFAYTTTISRETRNTGFFTAWANLIGWK